MTGKANEGWESRLPKNNTIAMRLEPVISEKIAKMAWKSGLKTTRQAKLILSAGLAALEKNGEIPEATVPHNQVPEQMGELPADTVQKLETAAKKHGRTLREEAERSLMDGLELQDAIEAVSDLLSQTPPPFSENGWKPDENECLNFVRKTIAAGISREKRRLATLKEVEEIYKSQDGMCAICGKHIELDEAVRDHIVPLRKGGSLTNDNIQLVCQPCNISKSNH